MRIALDAMTSELGVEEAVLGVFHALRDTPELAVLAVGDPKVLEPLLARGPEDLRARVEVVAAAEVIAMDDDAALAFKAKKDASVSVAARLVKQGHADGALSPGNTAASVIAATLLLGRLQGVRRPAILTPLPQGQGGYCGLLDAGGVVDARPEDLVQWAVMGSVYMEQVLGVAAPRVGLLSNGEEEGKGNAQVLEAWPLLKAAPIRFVGNVEGRDLFNGHCDVAVADGFTGNVVLKTAEGLAKMILGLLREEYARQGLLPKLGGLLSKPVFRAMHSRLSPDSAGGGPLLGVDGNFIITHGRANRTMIANGLRVAAECARQDLRGRLELAFKAAA